MEDLSRNLGKKRGESSENESISVSYMVTYQKNTTRNSNLTSTESFKLIIESMEKEIFEMKQALKVKIEEQELLKSILTQSKSELSNLDNEIERDQSRLDSAHKRLISLEREQNQLNEEMKKIEDETVQMKSNIEEVKIAYRKEVDQLSVDLQNATIKYRNFMQLNNSKEDQKGLMDEQSQLQTKAAQLEEDVKKYETLLKSISAPEAQNSEENVSIRRNIKYLKMCLNKELEEF